MAIHMKTKVNVRAWEEVEEDNILFAPDDNLVEDVVDNMDHIVTGKLTIPDSGTVNIPIDDITTVRGCYFRADQDVDISIDGGPTQHLHKPGTGTPDNPTYCKLYMDGTFTTLAVTKPHDPLNTPANVRYAVWGDLET